MQQLKYEKNLQSKIFKKTWVIKDGNIN
jgi:hypothetical protein